MRFNPSAPTDLRARRFAAHLNGLAFEVHLPHDWVAQAAPIDPTCARADPARHTLAAMQSADGRVRLRIEAWPGDLREPLAMSRQVQQLLAACGLSLCATGVGRLGPLPAVTGEALRDGGRTNEGGAAEVEHWHLALARHGGRVLVVGLACPLSMAVGIDATWQALLDSFRPQPDADAPRAASDSGAAAPTEAGHLTVFALADDAASLTATHPINAGLARRGVGRVAQLLSLDLDARVACIDAPGLQGRLTVPLGWHPIDDGRRLLLLEPSGGVQLQLDTVVRLGRSPREVIDALEAEARALHAGVECLRLRDGRLQALALRGLHQGRRAIEQVHLLLPGAEPDLLLRARVTATPERAGHATRLAEAVLASVEFDGAVRARRQGA